MKELVALRKEYTTEATSPLYDRLTHPSKPLSNSVEVYLGRSGYLSMHFPNAVTVIQDDLVSIGCFTDVQDQSSDTCSHAKQ